MEQTFGASVRNYLEGWHSWMAYLSSISDSSLYSAPWEESDNDSNIWVLTSSTWLLDLQWPGLGTASAKSAQVEGRHIILSLSFIFSHSVSIANKYILLKTEIKSHNAYCTIWLIIHYKESIYFGLNRKAIWIILWWWNLKFPFFNMLKFETSNH